MAQNNPHKDHRDRVREEYLSSGPDAFNDIRALELLLFYAIPRRDTNEMAHALLDEFGSLYGVFSASVDDLCRVEGIGPSAAILINLIPSIMSKAETGGKQKGVQLNSSSAAEEYIASCLKAGQNEKFMLFCLDAKKRVKKTYTPAEGVVNSVQVNVRRVAELALACHASSCIIAHNHPEGDPLPSEEDRELTGMISSALGALGIPLVDHIIVSSKGCFSFASAGLL